MRINVIGTMTIPIEMEVDLPGKPVDYLKYPDGSILVNHIIDDSKVVQVDPWAMAMDYEGKIKVHKTKHKIEIENIAFAGEPSIDWETDEWEESSHTQKDIDAMYE